MRQSFSEDDGKAVLNDDKRRTEAEKVLEDKNEVEKLLKNVIRSLDNIPVVGTFFADVPTLCMLVSDYISGAYTAIPVASIITIVVALIYFVSPIDLIPDVIPLIGLTDDAVVIAIAVGTVHNDIADYKKWKKLPSKKIKSPRDLLKNKK